MSVLHTVNKSPFEKSSLASCLRHAAEGSAVLLLEDAVYAALAGTRLEPLVREGAERLSLYVLAPDLHARGMQDSTLVAGIGIIDYDGFVDLAVSHHTVHAWL